jgi:hypothetical protein
MTSASLTKSSNINFLDLVFDGDRRGKLDFSSKSMRVHWVLVYVSLIVGIRLGRRRFFAFVALR